MEDDYTKIVWGAMIAAITGLYGFFIKHVIKHADREETNKQIDDLWEKKQSSDRCSEIVKRIDGNFEQLNDKLDIILGHVEKK